MARVATIKGSREKLMWLMDQSHFSKLFKNDWKDIIGVNKQRFYKIGVSDTANLTLQNIEQANQFLNKYLKDNFNVTDDVFTVSWWKLKNNWSYILPSLNINYYSEYEFTFKEPIRFRFNQLLDDIKKKYSIKYDEEIAETVKVSKASLSLLRSGQMSGLMLLKVIYALESNYKAHWAYVFGLSNVMYKGKLSTVRKIKTS